MFIENIGEREKNSEFISQQKKRIERRLEKYKPFFSKTVLSPYEDHKIRNVVPNLIIALRQIDTGCYGICINCRQEIPTERLKAIPGAIRCVRCQKKENGERNNISVKNEFFGAYKKIAPIFLKESWDVFLERARSTWKEIIERIVCEKTGNPTSLSENEVEHITEGTLLGFETFLEYFVLAVKKM